jgi:hypothetical protein
MSKATKVPVTKRALVQRLSRALAKEGEGLRKSRGTQAHLDVGEYYAFDLSKNVITRKHFDLEELGRKLGVLEPFEALSDE